MLDRSNELRYRASMRVTLVSVVANVLLSVAQVAVGIIGKSQALVADGLHTLSDLLTDFVVLLTLKHGHNDADEEHPCGHARIGPAVTLLLGIVLFTVGSGIASSACIKLVQREVFVTPTAMTLWIAFGTL